MIGQLSAALDLVTLVVSSLVSLAPFWWLIGASVVCACTAIAIRLLIWR